MFVAINSGNRKISIELILPRDLTLMCEQDLRQILITYNLQVKLKKTKISPKIVSLIMSGHGGFTTFHFLPSLQMDPIS
jgi:hypothetical protein